MTVLEVKKRELPFKMTGLGVTKTILPFKMTGFEKLEVTN